MSKKKHYLNSKFNSTEFKQKTLNNFKIRGGFFPSKRFLRLYGQSRNTDFFSSRVYTAIKLAEFRKTRNKKSNHY